MDKINFAYLTAINEMAQPRAIHKSTTYYHGTDTHKAAESIIKSGKIKAPDLTDRHGNLRPLDGQVYMTSDIAYAQIYAIGGDMAGSDSSSFLKGKDQYGFIFVIDNKSVKDIQPDEDSVGEMIYTYNEEGDYRLRWLDELAKEYLSNEFDQDLEDGDWGYGQSIYDNILEGLYEYYAVGGKILLDRMNDAQKLYLIKLGAHISNRGSLSFKEVWRLNKFNLPKLKRNASNIQQFVDKDKSGKKFLKDM